MNFDQPKYWFPAKRYGWGWGVPATWQGWCILALYVVAVTIVGVVVTPRSILISCGIVALLSIFLVTICYAKGEPPRWRWGK